MPAHQGKVTEELLRIIGKQLDDHGIVVWYDPEGSYGHLVSRLELPDTPILRFDGSFFELRHRLESYLEFVNDQGGLFENPAAAPRVLVYVPMDRRDTHHALVEAESAGSVVEPGAGAWQRNTRLKVIAERVFKKIAPDRAADIAGKAEAGLVRLEELDRLAEQAGDMGLLPLVFGTSSTGEIILGFLSDDRYDEKIGEKEALPVLVSLLEYTLGVPVDSDAPIAQIREQVRRSLLLAEFSLKVAGGDQDVEALASIPVPAQRNQAERVLTLCRDWRNRTDLWEGYAQAARKVESALDPGSLELDPLRLMEVETFSFIEDRLLEWAEAQLLAEKEADVIGWARRRLQSFWSRYDGEYGLRWALMENAARLVATAGCIERELKRIGSDVEAMIGAYAARTSRRKRTRTAAWHLLDRCRRHLEHRYAVMDFKVGGKHPDPGRTLALARRRYVETTGRCAEAFAEALRKADFQVPGVMRQREVFSRMVRPRIQEGKTAYVLVDALRYEMGLELMEGLSEEFQFKISPALAQPPTITEIGMAALLLGEDEPVELADAGSGRVAIRAGSSLLKDRASRIKHFQSRAGAPKTAALKLNDLMKPDQATRKSVADAELVLVTSREIDRRGEETDHEEDARRFMEQVLDKLHRGLRQLAALGVKTMVITADHGYLFVDAPGEDMKVDAPGGRTVDLHPRVWIGRGGTDPLGCLRIKAADLGLGGDLEMVFPKGLARFKAPGKPSGYFHGGISLQEMLIPVAVVHVRGVGGKQLSMTFIEAKPAKPKITTRFFSVELCLRRDRSREKTKRVKVIARADGSQVGQAAMAAYGFEEGTGEIVLEKDRPNTVTMMLTADVDAPTVSVHVLDAENRVELCVIKNMIVDIAI